MINKPFALSVKALVRDHLGRYLALRRSAASKYNAGRWDFPGGKVDSGEVFDAALIREVVEETGLRVELDSVAGIAQSEIANRTVVYLIMEAHVVGGELRLSSEHSESKWLLPAELQTVGLCDQFMSFAEGFSANAPATLE